MRHSLSDKSVRAATVLGSWTDLQGAIPHDDIVRSFGEKNKRPKGKGNKALSVDGTAEQEVQPIVVDE
jgi:hypothetical protein